MTIQLLTILIMKFRRWNINRRLKWQEMLAGTGIGFRTKILEIKKGQQFVHGYKKCAIRTSLRIRGKIVCRQVVTFLSEGINLQPGDHVLIKYNPQHVHTVLVIQRVEHT